MSNFRGEASGDRGAMSNFCGEASGDRGEASNFRGEATNFILHMQIKVSERVK